MKDFKIIAILGMPGSGKGTCTDYLQEKYNWPVAHFGSMVYEEVQRRGLDNVKDEKLVRNDMRAKEGKAVLAKRVAAKADDFIKKGAGVVLLDGLYSWSENKFLTEKYGDRLITIAIAAPKAERYKRNLARNDAHRKYMSKEQLIARDIDEIEDIEKGGPIAFADYTILNDGEPDKLIEHLETLIQRLDLL